MRLILLVLTVRDAEHLRDGRRRWPRVVASVPASYSPGRHEVPIKYRRHSWSAAAPASRLHDDRYGRPPLDCTTRRRVQTSWQSNERSSL